MHEKLVAYDRWSLIGKIKEISPKGLFTKWLLTGGGRLREVVARRELTVAWLCTEPFNIARSLTTGVNTCSGASWAKALYSVKERITTDMTINRAPTNTPTENHRWSKYGWIWPNLTNDLLYRVVYHRTWHNDKEIPLFSRNSLYLLEYFL